MNWKKRMGKIIRLHLALSLVVGIAGWTAWQSMGPVGAQENKEYEIAVLDETKGSPICEGSFALEGRSDEKKEWQLLGIYSLADPQAIVVKTPPSQLRWKPMIQVNGYKYEEFYPATGPITELNLPRNTDAVLDHMRNSRLDLHLHVYPPKANMKWSLFSIPKPTNIQGISVLTRATFNVDFGHLFAPYRSREDLLVTNRYYLSEQSRFGHFLITYSVTDAQGEAEMNSLYFNQWNRLALYDDNEDISAPRDQEPDPKIHVRGPRYVNSQRTRFTYDIYYIESGDVNKIIADGYKKAYQKYLQPNYRPNKNDLSEVLQGLKELKKEKDQSAFAEIKAKMEEILTKIELLEKAGKAAGEEGNPPKPAEPTPAPSAAPLPTKPVKPTPAPSAAPLPTKPVEPTPAPSAAPLPTKPVEPTPAPSAAPLPTKPVKPTPAPSAAPLPTKPVEPTPAPSAAPLPTKPAKPTPAPSAAPLPTKPAETKPVETTAVTNSSPASSFSSTEREEIQDLFKKAAQQGDVGALLKAISKIKALPDGKEKDSLFSQAQKILEDLQTAQTYRQKYAALWTKEKEKLQPEDEKLFKSALAEWETLTAEQQAALKAEKQKLEQLQFGLPSLLYAGTTAAASQVNAFKNKYKELLQTPLDALRLRDLEIFIAAADDFQQLPWNVREAMTAEQDQLKKMRQVFDELVKKMVRQEEENRQQKVKEFKDTYKEVLSVDWRFVSPKLKETVQAALANLQQQPKEIQLVLQAEKIQLETLLKAITMREQTSDVEWLNFIAQEELKKDLVPSTGAAQAGLCRIES